jgi:ABC-type cobalamin/Fe3+-siderophores transport system ATPase subunit
VFRLEIPKISDDPLVLERDPGSVLFVVGANGSGKSSLTLRLYQQNKKHARRISAHRNHGGADEIAAF